MSPDDLFSTMETWKEEVVRKQRGNTALTAETDKHREGGGDMTTFKPGEAREEEESLISWGW